MKEENDCKKEFKLFFRCVEMKNETIPNECAMLEKLFVNCFNKKYHKWSDIITIKRPMFPEYESKLEK